MPALALVVSPDRRRFQLRYVVRLVYLVALRTAISAIPQRIGFFVDGHLCPLLLDFLLPCFFARLARNVAILRVGTSRVLPIFLAGRRPSRINCRTRLADTPNRSPVSDVVT